MTLFLTVNPLPACLSASPSRSEALLAHTPSHVMSGRFGWICVGNFPENTRLIQTLSVFLLSPTQHYFLISDDFLIRISTEFLILLSTYCHLVVTVSKKRLWPKVVIAGSWLTELGSQGERARSHNVEDWSLAFLFQTQCLIELGELYPQTRRYTWDPLAMHPGVW